MLATTAGQGLGRPPSPSLSLRCWRSPDAAATTSRRRPTAATTDADRTNAGMPETGDGKGGIELEKVGDFDAPLYVTQPADDGDDIYVVEQGGTIERVTPSGDQRPSSTSPTRSSAAASRDCCRWRSRRITRTTGRFYVDYTNTDGDTRVVEYTAKDGVVDESSARELLAVDQPYPNHNGGLVLFGPDGDLYIGLGDGGGGGDPERRGLDLSTLLGKILRIDPAPDGSSPYTVPDDNPFVDRQGAAARDLLLRPPQPMALLLRSRDRRSDDRRRRPGRRGGDRRRRPRGGLGRELRLVRLRGRPALQRRPERPRRDPAGARRPALRRQLLDHRRAGGARPGPGLPLRALPLGRLLRRSAAQLHAAARSARGGRHGRSASTSNGSPASARAPTARSTRSRSRAPSTDWRPLVDPSLGCPDG